MPAYWTKTQKVKQIFIAERFYTISCYLHCNYGRTAVYFRFSCPQWQSYAMAIVFYALQFCCYSHIRLSCTSVVNCNRFEILNVCPNIICSIGININYKYSNYSYVIIILKIFKIFSMQILSSKSKYFVVFLILLKLAGITSISNFGNQGSRYLSSRLKMNKIK